MNRTRARQRLALILALVAVFCGSSAIVVDYARAGVIPPRSPIGTNVSGSHVRPQTVCIAYRQVILHYPVTRRILVCTAHKVFVP